MGQILIGGQRAVVYKDPDEVRDFTVDWTADLPDGVSIADASFLPDDATLVVDSATHDDTGAAGRFSGGVNGQQYRVTNRVELSDGQIYDYGFTVSVRQA